MSFQHIHIYDRDHLQQGLSKNSASKPRVHSTAVDV